MIKNGGRVYASNSTRNAIAGPISIPEGVGIFEMASGRDTHLVQRDQRRRHPAQAEYRHTDSERDEYFYR